MTEKEQVKISKFLSLVLRHKPEAIGISLDENGWANVEDLIQKANSYQQKLNSETLRIIVENNNKKRFAFNEDETKIRANQGHSIKVNLELKQAIPPPCLYHGTGEKYLAGISEEGLKKMSRHHVHLSSDKVTARKVGQRHGKPVIFEIDSAAMTTDKFQFYISENGVWLTDFVPIKYMKILSGGSNNA